MRKKIAAGNWKMNTTLDEGKQLINDILKGLKENPPAKGEDAISIIFGTPFITLPSASELVKDNTLVHIAAQNCYNKEMGAYTGETSVDMIRSTGAGFVIVGHSERREYFSESDEVLAQKVDLTLSRKLKPIFCCGEKLEVRQANGHVALVKKQIEKGLFHLNVEQIQQVVIAYEPVWAIGTGVTASPEQAQEMHAVIRQLLSDKYGAAVAAEISILYGGSVNAANATELFSQTDVDGGLVGGASLKANDFLTIIHAL